MKTTKIHDALELFQLDDKRDLEYCGRTLSAPLKSSYLSVGAHAPTHTCYFVLDILFSYFEFTPNSKLLDVGCGTGRVLAYFSQMKYPGIAVGIEIDPLIAERSRNWSNSYSNLNVLTGNVLDIDLGLYTHFYLFNPFEDAVLAEFVQKLEGQTRGNITLCYMSDDPSIGYVDVNNGWSIIASGFIQDYQGIQVYGSPQHYSILQYRSSHQAS